jgi:hypothetical protein
MKGWAYVTLTVAAILLLSSVETTSAHEHRHVEMGGKETEWVVGWYVEPAFVDQPNKVSLRVRIEQESQTIPVTGLEKFLRVEVTTGGKSVTLDLRPAFRDPGHYIADIMPTVPGTYIFRFFGTVNGTSVNETFDCSQGQFDCVKPLSSIQFPETPPTSRDVQNALNSINSKLQQLDDSLTSLIQARTSAQSTADNALLLGAGGLAAGIAGLLVAIVALTKSRSPG